PAELDRDLEYGTTEDDRSCNIVCRIAASSSSSYSGVIISDAFTVGVGPVSAPKTALVDYTYNSAAVTFSTDDLNGNSAVIYTGSIYNGRKRVAEVTSVGGCVFTGLEPETTYTIVVTARGDKNTGSVPGETIEFTTLPRPSETNAYIHTFTGYVSNSAVEDAVGTLAPGGRLTIITEADGAAITPSQLAMINQYEAGISVEAPLVGTEYDVGAFKDIDLGNNPLILMQCAAVETDSRLVMNYITGGAPAYYVCAFSGSTEIHVAGNIKVTFAADENAPYLIAVKDEEIVASGLYSAEDGVVTIAASGKTVYVLISEEELMETEIPFADVTEDDWFCEYVEYVYTTGIMDGMEETVFAPNTRTNRAMMATVLYRLFGGSESEDAPDITEVFSDIKGDEWYVKYITWAYTKGILNGYEDGTVRPEAVITRQEMVVMIYRYCSACGIDVTTGLADISVYEDSGSVAS
ncbi:MAG: S-layer homology domain-containing protein, partial [Oscillospiraceae bacterium]|nr:S-layer homology domain-containing protein [Oscillospiraceae bacterium]